LRSTLGPSFAKLEQLIATHGLISHLAEHLIETANADPGLAAPEKVIEVFETLVAVRPREGSWRLRLANRRLIHRDFGLALNDYLAALALKLEPEDRIGALVGAGNACAELGRTDEACGYFRKALGENPRSAYARENLAICLVRGQRPAEAVAALQDALKMDDGNPEYWFLSAAAHHALGNTAQVAEATERAVRLAPNKPKYVLALAQQESEIKHYERAIELYTRALGILGKDADRADALFMRGRARQAIGEIDGARADYAAVEALAGPLAARATKALRGLQQRPSGP
jgi:tetratricopeptide (TPR) repeat protein